MSRASPENASAPDPVRRVGGDAHEGGGERDQHTTPVRHGDDRLPARFWSKTIVDPRGCWLWTASTNSDNYANYCHGDERVAHRIAYQVLVGDIPAELELDHTCRVRHCVNVNHLELVTHSENVRRAVAHRRRQRQRHQLVLPFGEARP